jgi:hypothetical protein
MRAGRCLWGVVGVGSFEAAGVVAVAGFLVYVSVLLAKSPTISLSPQTIISECM